MATPKITSSSSYSSSSSLRSSSGSSSGRKTVKWRATLPRIFSFLVACVGLNLFLVMVWFRTTSGKGGGRRIVGDESSVSASASASASALESIFDLGLPLSSSSLTSSPSMAAPPPPVEPAVVVAHVVSLIKCTKASSVTGFLDAAAVLRHSIHRQSVHGDNSNSRYSYRMYAIVHTSCAEHGSLLETLGYTSIIRDSPIRIEEIKGTWYRDHVEGENCCGSAEFIKLYAYELLDHPIVVHWDMDVAILKPLDDLYDSMLHPKDSELGRRARRNLELQHPERSLPDRIDAFFTRDVTSAQPWERVQGVQGGFLVARPSKVDFDAYLDLIREGNYTRGRCDTCGWGGLGYGGFQGAMAYQGVVAYFYDRYRPNAAVELNACRWNQVVADVIWRGPSRMEHHMQCRQYPSDGNFETNTRCEDCRSTPIDLVRTVHYTACKKPWECQIPHPRKPRDKRQEYRLSHLTNITTCGLLFREWFALRHDFEGKLQSVAGVVPAPRDGAFHPDFFLGTCRGSGNYIPMNPPPDGFDAKQLYGL